jgi:hypothetical protein
MFDEAGGIKVFKLIQVSFLLQLRKAISRGQGIACVRRSDSYLVI